MSNALKSVLFGLVATIVASIGSAATATVTVEDPMQFSDDLTATTTTTIHAGDKVTWNWAGGPHSTTSGTCSPGGGPYGDGMCTSDGTWNSGLQNSGATFDHTFLNAGTFPYYCLNHTTSMTGTIVVLPASSCSTITLSPSSLPGAIKNISYSQTLSASGGASPYTFALSAGAFPPGVNISSSGTVSGAASATGTFNFTITATDAHQCTAAQPFSIGVSDDLPAGDAVVLPAVGSAPGAFGAVIRTQVQLTNASLSTVSGNIVFHPSGASASPGDPSMTYTLSSWQTVNFDDLVAAMGQSGIGSADLVPTSGPAPVVVARIYNDGGAAGTNGFAQLAFQAHEASQVGDFATFILPSDAANYRFNIGVRTLNDGVTATFEVWDAQGNLVHTSQKTLPANSLTLQAGGAFLDGITLPANGSISLTVTHGSAIFFGATVDNRTQDGSTQFARHN